MFIIVVMIIFISLDNVFTEEQSLSPGSMLMRQMWMTPISVFKVFHEDSSCNEDDFQHDFYCNFHDDKGPFRVNDTQLRTIKHGILDYYEDYMDKVMNNPTRFKEKAATLSDLFYRLQQREDVDFKLCYFSNKYTSPCAIFANRRSFINLSQRR